MERRDLGSLSHHQLVRTIIQRLASKPHGWKHHSWKTGSKDHKSHASLNFGLCARAFKKCFVGLAMHRWSHTCAHKGKSYLNLAANQKLKYARYFKAFFNGFNC